MIDVLDINHRVITEGDLLLDSRGKVWRVELTENTLRSVRVLWGTEQRPIRTGWTDGARLPLHGYSVVVIDEAPRDPKDGALAYERAYEGSAERAVRQSEVRGMQTASMAAIARVRGDR